MDNSSVHQNNFLWDKEEEWSKKGLDIFFLPTSETSFEYYRNIVAIY